MKQFLKYWKGYNIHINIEKNSKNDDLLHVKSTTQSPSPSLSKFPLLMHGTEMQIAVDGNLSSQKVIFSGTAIQDMVNKSHINILLNSHKQFNAN